MLSAYPAIFIKEATGYSVIFPDLNYLATDGNSLNEALEMAIDCLAGYLFMAKLDNSTVPEPSELNKIDVKKHLLDLNFDNIECEHFLNIVTVDVEEYAKTHFNKAVKKTLTIPEWLNKEAIAKNINFSQVLQDALIAKLRSL